VHNDAYLDGLRSSTNQYRKWVEDLLCRFRSNPLFARHDLDPSDLVILVGDWGRHPFADTHPFCSVASLDPLLIGSEPPLVADFVVLVKYFRCLYDWRRWEILDPRFAARRKTLSEAIEAWLGREFELGVSFESPRSRASFVEQRWREFGFPIDIVGRPWEAESWAQDFENCREAFREAAAEMFEQVDLMDREVSGFVNSPGGSFDQSWRSWYGRSDDSGGSPALRIERRSELDWVPDSARIPESKHLGFWHHMAVFSVADMFLRRMARKERPVGSGRAGLCAYLAAEALDRSLTMLGGAFGADTVTVDNALILKKHFGNEFEWVLEMVLGGKTASELYAITGESPRALM
jgi:hypothetical protein